MELKRIDHVCSRGERRLREARGIEVTWPPFLSGTAQMIWTNAETSGGVQYQFLVRPAPENQP